MIAFYGFETRHLYLLLLVFFVAAGKPAAFFYARSDTFSLSLNARFLIPLRSGRFVQTNVHFKEKQPNKR